ncbi:hypothetical protein ET495_15180 [Xylanimonas allomyrinae]|uniref:Chromosome condensation regulator RCC1 n=1 Tax=Xylanimonas allomyrinae TaxID=2509459 RepID=A0A4P6EPG2_9MICO|nr:hypothetical protein [Xylanimonas allomyrinae]QAY64325.1 hypothetical protein ET495_15180 [Xylanimonas allomyrinae]
MALAALVVAALVAEPSAAGFRDVTYAQAELPTVAAPGLVPVVDDRSAGSALFLDQFGALYVAGDQKSGDGAGGNPKSTSVPTKVTFPKGLRIIEAAGASNDYDSDSRTAWAALDSSGVVWTWGAVWNGPNLLGRGTIGAPESYTPGKVVAGPGGKAPHFIDLELGENQFYALDEKGTMWVWGYGSENLPTLSRDDASYPVPANLAAKPGKEIDKCGSNDIEAVTWHSIWGGYNAGAAVSTAGLIYTWGFDNSDGMTGSRNSQLCPYLNPGANEALFMAYQDTYKDASGSSYELDPDAATFSDRKQRVAAIADEMKTRTICGGPIAKALVDDNPGCPVRQIGYGARAPRMLLQNGDLYTWQVSADYTYGGPMLGREPVGEHADSERYSPGVALANVVSVVDGIGSVVALKDDGTVYGWGRNDYCQAIGVHAKNAEKSCGTIESDEVVALPTRVYGLPESVPVTSLAATQCAAWAIASDGSMYAWGGGTIVGDDYVKCVSGRSLGYKIYDQTKATGALPFGEPVTADATGTIKVRDKD